MGLEAKSQLLHRFKSNTVIRFCKYYVTDNINIVRNQGFKALLRQRGWKTLMVVLLYYFIRDSILYIILPFMFAKSFIN